MSQSKLSAISKLKEASKKYENNRRAQEEISANSFQARVAHQQFMNAHASLFNEFARRSNQADSSYETNTLAMSIRTANKLALKVASRVLDKEEREITPDEIRHYRGDCSAFVASRWFGKSVREQEIDEIATQIAEALSLSNPTFDINPYRGMKISDETSLKMTTLGMVTGLVKNVSVYDFRQNPQEVVARLSRHILNYSETLVSEMLPDESVLNDRLSLRQSLIKHLSNIMASCYEQKAREVVYQLDGKSEDEKVAWFNQNDPIADIIEDHKNWCLCLAGFSLASTREKESVLNNS